MIARTDKPRSMLAPLIGKEKTMAKKVHIDEDECIGCGTCENVSGVVPVRRSARRFLSSTATAGRLR